MAAEGELVAETSVNHVDSLPVPVPPKEKKTTGKSVKCWRCYQPETDRRFRFKP